MCVGYKIIACEWILKCYKVKKKNISIAACCYALANLHTAPTDKTLIIWVQNRSIYDKHDLN